MLQYAILWMLGINLWTMLRFRDDKRRAITGSRRIPEASLLQLAVLGGSPAAFAARHWFRHKTHKQPFSTDLMLIATAQIGIAIGLFVLCSRG